MTDAPEAADRVPARETRSRWPGLVWAVPLAALLIALYLGLRAFTDRGIEVVVTFPDAHGVRAGTTRVVYQGLEAGKVTKVDLNPDGRRVDLTLSLIPRSKPVLVTGTVFFLMGAKPNIADPSSLSSALSGVTVGAYPSHSGTPTRHFVGLEQPPPIAPDTEGRTVTLWGTNVGALKPGSKVSYNGVTVGKVVAVGIVDATRSRVDAFVQAPFDRLLTPNSAFWSKGALSLAVSGRGLDADVDTDAIFSGEVAFSTPPKPVTPGARRNYRLFPNQSSAEATTRGPEVAYRAVLPGEAASIQVGAPVSLDGRPVGLVRQVDFRIDEGTADMAAVVVVGLSPEALGLKDAGVEAPAYWRRRTDALLSRMAARGWRLAAVQSPPLVGGRALEFRRGAAGSLVGGAPYPTLPATPEAGDLSAKAGQLLDRLNRLPLDAIGRNLEQATAGLARLSNSPRLADAVAHADGALAKADAILGEVRPNVRPLMADLRHAASALDAVAADAHGLVTSGSAGGADIPDALREVADAARSIRELTDYLGRHPEAVLTGKRKGRSR